MVLVDQPLGGEMGSLRGWSVRSKTWNELNKERALTRARPRQLQILSVDRPSASVTDTQIGAMSSTETTTARAEPITAETIHRLFPDIDTSGQALEGHDEEQIRLMDEVCIVLDENDVPIGKASKKICA